VGLRTSLWTGRYFGEQTEIPRIAGYFDESRDIFDEWIEGWTKRKMFRLMARWFVK
jgi:hypothetical protein